MAAETNQISPPSPSHLPTTDVTSSSPQRPPRDDALEVKTEAPKQEAESGQEEEVEEEEKESNGEQQQEESEEEEEEESQRDPKKRRVTGPSTLRKLSSFTFDVKSLAATPEATPRFGSDATFFQERPPKEVENKGGGDGEARTTVEEEGKREE